MPIATVNKKGQLVIPAAIRARYGLTPGTQVEFLDDGRVIRLRVSRNVAPSEPTAGYGMVKVMPLKIGAPRRRLSDFDPAATMKRK